ncbi:MAG: hypothetical protein RL745_672, partial [Actinomycetota bacterium]
VHTMHTIGAVKNEQTKASNADEPTMRTEAELRIGREANVVTANTSAEEAELVRLCGVEPQRITVVPPGIDVDIFNPTARISARQIMRIEPETFVISFVGRLQPHKGPDLAIAAVAEFLSLNPHMRSFTRVFICGGVSGAAGFSRQELSALADSRGIGSQVEFIAPVPPAELASLYGASDVLLVPSVSESFGLVALEAQACGTPVIATAQGGLLTSVADGLTGVLVPTRNPDEWADAIGQLADRAIRSPMSAAAADHARMFTWARTADHLLKAYRAVAL